MSTNYINVEPEMDENDYMQPNANQPAVYERLKEEAAAFAARAPAGVAADPIVYAVPIEEVESGAVVPAGGGLRAGAGRRLAGGTGAGAPMTRPTTGLSADTEKVAEVTGLSSTEATGLLRAHGGDANTAILAHLDALALKGESAPPPLPPPPPTGGQGRGRVDSGVLSTVVLRGRGEGNDIGHDYSRKPSEIAMQAMNIDPHMQAGTQAASTSSPPGRPVAPKPASLKPTSPGASQKVPSIATIEGGKTASKTKWYFPDGIEHSEYEALLMARRVGGFVFRKSRQGRFEGGSIIPNSTNPQPYFALTVKFASRKSETPKKLWNGLVEINDEGLVFVDLAHMGQKEVLVFKNLTAIVYKCLHDPSIKTKIGLPVTLSWPS